VIVVEDFGEVGQKSLVTSRGTCVITACGGPARCCKPGFQGGQV
jgi:hypothetical protein